MDGGHMYNYDHLHRTVLLEHKCNFRLALMYSKSFLSTLVCTMWYAMVRTMNVRSYHTICYGVHNKCFYVPHDVPWCAQWMFVCTMQYALVWKWVFACTMLAWCIVMNSLKQLSRHCNMLELPKVVTENELKRSLFITWQHENVTLALPL